MRKIARFVLLALTMAMAAPLFAGGLWFEIGNPKAVRDPAARDAFATVRVFTFGGVIAKDPVFTGTAEGLVNHQRVSMPLTFTKLAPEGLYAIRWERPKEGTWALDLRLHEFGPAERRVVVHNLSADLFAVAEDGVKPMVSYAGGLSPGRVDFELRALAGEQILTTR